MLRTTRDNVQIKSCTSPGSDNVEVEAWAYFKDSSVAVQLTDVPARCPAVQVTLHYRARTVRGERAAHSKREVCRLGCLGELLKPSVVVGGEGPIGSDQVMKYEPVSHETETFA
jgi:hypothetical protein